MKTWLMYRNHYGHNLPEPKYQSSFKGKSLRSRGKRYKAFIPNKEKKLRLEDIPLKSYLKEVLILVFGLIVFLACLHYLN